MLFDVKKFVAAACGNVAYMPQPRNFIYDILFFMLVVTAFVVFLLMGHRPHANDVHRSEHIQVQMCADNKIYMHISDGISNGVVWLVPDTDTLPFIDSISVSRTFVWPI